MNPADDRDATDAELLAEMKRAWSENRRFFSNAGKEERERWVVAELLTGLHVAFDSRELHSPAQRSKVDVVFRDARFQVKEIPDPNFRRGDDIKATYIRVMNAKTLRDTVGPGFPYDIPPVSEAIDLVRDTAFEAARSRKYSSQRANLDFLCYVTRPRASPIALEHVDVPELSSLGWRSISYLMGKHAAVLCAAPNAPQFMFVAERPSRRLQRR